MVNEVTILLTKGNESQHLPEEICLFAVKNMNNLSRSRDPFILADHTRKYINKRLSHADWATETFFYRTKIKHVHLVRMKAHTQNELPDINSTPARMMNVIMWPSFRDSSRLDSLTSKETVQAQQTRRQ